jgi:hypothetical protein
MILQAGPPRGLDHRVALGRKDVEVEILRVPKLTGIDRGCERSSEGEGHPEAQGLVHDAAIDLPLFNR